MLYFFLYSLPGFHGRQSATRTPYVEIQRLGMFLLPIALYYGVIVVGAFLPVGRGLWFYVARFAVSYAVFNALFVFRGNQLT